jgi:hypothetical protein
VIENKSHLGSRDDFEWGVVKCPLIVFSAFKQNEWKMGLMKAHSEALMDSNMKLVVTTQNPTCKLYNT